MKLIWRIKYWPKDGPQWMSIPSITLIPRPARYAAQLLTPAMLTARADGASRIAPAHIEAVHSLFLDAKSSARILNAQADKYMK